MPPIPSLRRGAATLVAGCALGALLAPAALAADTADKVAVPGADIAKLAAKHRTSVAEILQRQARLAPIIKELAPAAKQPTVKPSLRMTKIAKASVDECFVAIGQDGPAPDPQGNCPAGSRPKRNQAYPFGAVRSGDFMYFGTLSNAACSASQGYGLEPVTFAGDDVVCEGNQGWASRHLGWARLGDTRRPQVVRINADTNQTEDITPSEAQAPLLKYSTALRGQGAKDDVVLLGGLNLNSTGTAYAGVELLAFEGSTGKFLGEKLMPEYANIRRGSVIDGDLYFGVRLNGTGFGGGGAVLKWTGDKQDPFKFEVVAKGLASEPAYLTGHDGHLITSGWTIGGAKAPENAMAAMYQSPKIPAGGLTAATADAANWKPIFKASDYDPDPVIARAIQFGDLTSYNGKLVFSTYVYAGYPTFNAFAYYGKPADEIGRINTMLNAERAIAVFEMDNVGEADQKVRLLYGDATLPTYNTQTKRWERKPNVLKQAPKYGAAGFGNRFNSYSWMWEQYKGSLYMSTMDVTSLIKGAMPMLAGPMLGLSGETVDLLQPVFNLLWTVQGGGDVWRFDGLDRPAVPETLDGFGNKNSHGVRAWTAFPDKNKLFAGMATWANLNNSAKHSGGWEVNQLQG